LHASTAKILYNFKSSASHTAIQQVAYVSGHVLVHSINWLAKHKKLLMILLLICVK